MSAGGDPVESTAGYLSEESKRRFTLMAGMLGAGVFLAQMVLPILVVFLVMMPTIFGRQFTTRDVAQAALWRGEFWFVERTARLNWRDLENSTAELVLARARLADLAEVEPGIPLGDGSLEGGPALLALGDRLWVLGEDLVGHTEGGPLTRLDGASRPARASRPFAYGGRPAVISLGASPLLATLDADGDRAAWTTRELRLDLPSESGALRSLQAVEAGGDLYLFSELCTEAPKYCALYYRQLDEAQWLPLVADAGSRASWSAIASGSQPAVVLRQSPRGGPRRISVVTVTADGPRREDVEEAQRQGQISTGWRPFSLEGRLLILAEGMPGSLQLTELADGRISRSAKRGSAFPFSRGMMALMLIPQLLPLLLSLVLALALTAQMRHHRVPDYVVGGEHRSFASLWQRAIAQLVDLVPLAGAAILPMAPMWRLFSAPERFVEAGPRFPFLLFGLMIAGFVSALLVLVVYSYFEGRFGKTPGKWLVGIRVLGTDLRFCGFGRALLRNLLTFVDGFLNFLVGAMLVALTENWQRLGDLAARTVVLVDEKREGTGRPAMAR